MFYDNIILFDSSRLGCTNGQSPIQTIDGVILIIIIGGVNFPWTYERLHCTINHIGSAVSVILWYQQTERLIDILLLLYQNCPIPLDPWISKTFFIFRNFLEQYLKKVNMFFFLSYALADKQVLFLIIY